MLVVAVAMLGSLTVLPALLSRLGDKVEKGRIPFIGRLRRERGENRVWATVLTPALRHPVVTVDRVGGRAASRSPLPVLHIHTAQTGLDALPKSIADRPDARQDPDGVPGRRHAGARRDQGEHRLAGHADGDRRASQTQALATGQMTGPIEVDVNPAHTVARVAIPLDGQRHRLDVAAGAAHAARRRSCRRRSARCPGATYAVTGGTAASADENALLKHSAPLVFGFVLTFAFILLLVSFRSIVIAAKAIVLNLLSVARRLRRARDRLPVGLGRERC